MGTAASLAGEGSSSSGYVDERDSLPGPHDVADAGVPSGVSLASIPEAEEGVALVSAAMEIVARGLHATGAMEPPALVLGQLQAMYGRHQVTLIVPHLAVALFLTRLEGRLLQGPLLRALAASLFSATATADAAAVAYAAAVKAADAAYAADVRAGTGAGAKAAKTAATAKTARRGAGGGSASAGGAAAPPPPSSDSLSLTSVAAEHDGLRAFVLGHLSSPGGGSVDSLATCVAAVAAALGRRNQYPGRAGGARNPPTSLDPSVDELRAFDALDQGLRSKAKAKSEEKRSSELNQGLRGAQLATETAVPRTSPDIAHVLRLDTGLVPPRLPPPPPRGDDSSEDSSDDEDDEKKRGGGGGVQGNVEVWNPSVDENQWASNVLPPLTRSVFVLKVQQVQDAWRWQRRQDEGRDTWERSRSRRTKRYDDEEEGELLSDLRLKLSPRGCAEARAARVKGVGEFWDEDWDASGTCEWVFKRGGEWWYNRGMALMGETGADGVDGGETKSTGSEGTLGSSRVVLISGGIGMGKTMLVVNCITRFPRHVVGHLFCDLLGRRGGTRWGGRGGEGGGAAREAVMSLSAQLCEHSELGRKYVRKRTVDEGATTR